MGYGGGLASEGPGGALGHRSLSISVQLLTLGGRNAQELRERREAAVTRLQAMRRADRDGFRRTQWQWRASFDPTWVERPKRAR